MKRAVTDDVYCKWAVQALATGFGRSLARSLPVECESLWCALTAELLLTTGGALDRPGGAR